MTHTNAPVSKRALVILPTLNEATNLPLLVPRILEHDGLRLMIVDDRSPDGTGDVADGLARQFPGRVEVVHRVGARGLGLAYAEAFPRAAASEVDVICQMDADLSHDPSHLPAMIAATEQHDVVIGSRYADGAGLVDFPGYRAALSRGANAYVRAVTGLGARDCTSGYRCWRRSAVRRIRWDLIGAEGFAFLVETLCEAAHLGCTIGEVPVIFVGRKHGASKLTGRVFRESLVVPWRVLMRFRGRRPTPR
ncbi:MAG TPA: polyprenol monophosphomannose synthase [Vicinamibacterales bacterium]|nr:polyprenol monophosphomannose synthase [Vicinamibacterales bacterium]